MRTDLKSKTPTKRLPKAIEAEDGTLTDRAYRELEEMIVTLQLSPGTVLSEQALAVRLKIGRTPIREALQRLARDGLVVIMPRRGIMVSEINLRLQLRLLEVRRELERLMASLAAERATPDERREFAEVAAAMLAAAAKADDIAFMRLDQQFNILIATAARNEFARRSMGLMNALSRRFWYQHYQQVADLPLAAKLHAAVADAGHDAAADQAGAVERNFLRDRNCLLIGYDAIFAERSQEHQLLQGTTVGERSPAGAVERQRLRPLAEIFLAQDRRIAVAIKAVPAMRIPRQHDMVADLRPARSRAGLLDHPGGFVPEHHRQRITQRTVNDFEIGMAKARGTNSHQ
jgi:DNA-binding GntR family transcriptional regulator